MSKRYDLTVEEIDALQSYAQQYGRLWRSHLELDWQSSEPDDPRSQVLHRLFLDPEFTLDDLARLKLPRRQG